MLFSLLLAHAHAVVIAGNPELVVSADLPGEFVTQASADLDEVVFNGCDGLTSHTIQVGQNIDLAAGWRTPAPDGDWCSVSFTWNSDITLSGTNGFGAWSGDATPASTLVHTDPGPFPADLTPWQVTQGVVIAGNPELVILFD